MMIILYVAWAVKSTTISNGPSLHSYLIQSLMRFSVCNFEHNILF